MKTFHASIFAIAALALTGTGCFSPAPIQASSPIVTALAKVPSESRLTDLTINVLPKRKTQGTGDFVTEGDGYVEIRMMYTEGVVRFDGMDYHIGLDSDGATGYKLNISTPSFNVVPLRYFNASASKPEYPFIPSISAAPSSVCADTATNSLLHGAYYLGRGIYAFMASGENDPAFDILWYDPADRNNSNYGYYNYSNTVTCYGNLTDAAISNASPSILAAATSFKTAFQGTTVVYKPSLSLPATASKVINPTLAAVNFTTSVCGAMQATSYDVVGPDGARAKAVYYKLVLPPNVQSVKFPHLPLGRLVLDVRKFNKSKVLGNYGYRQFMLAPSGNELSVDEIANIVLMDPVSIVF